MPLHNIQQLSDAVDALQAAGQKEAQDTAALFLSQVQPLLQRLSALESRVATVEAGLAAAVGTPAPPTAAQS